MNIPQYILNKFIIREDYLEWIDKEAAIFAYLDLTNMFHWQDVLGWKFRVEDIIRQLFTFSNIKEVKVYYGLNPRDKQNSKAFLNRIKRAGANLRPNPPKEMKFIPKSINEGLFFQRRTLTLFDGKIKGKIHELIDELQKSGIIIKVKDKQIGIVGVRGKVAGELHQIKDKYIDFGKFYTGKRSYI